MELVPIDIILLLNYAWKHSFVQVETNKKAIYKRSWLPYNRNLLLYPELTATMAKEDRISDGVNQLYVPQKKLSNSSLSSQTTKPSFDPKLLSKNNTQASQSQISQKLNFSSGVAYDCVEVLIGNEILMKKKEEMNNKKVVSEGLKESFEKEKRMTAGLIFKNNTYRLGTFFDIQEEQLKKKKMMHSL